MKNWALALYALLLIVIALAAFYAAIWFMGNA